MNISTSSSLFESSHDRSSVLLVPQYPKSYPAPLRSTLSRNGPSALWRPYVSAMASSGGFASQHMCIILHYRIVYETML